MADFVVRDASGKGIYDAKITMQLKYGFMGVRKIDLNVGTNADGKASIDGLPNKIRGTAQFKIAQGSRESFVEYDPAVHCYAMHNVTLSESTPSQTK